MMEFVLEMIAIIAGKGEYARNGYFLLFSYVFESNHSRGSYN